MCLPFPWFGDGACKYLNTNFWITKEKIGNGRPRMRRGPITGSEWGCYLSSLFLVFFLSPVYRIKLKREEVERDLKISPHFSFFIRNLRSFCTSRPPRRPHGNPPCLRVLLTRKLMSGLRRTTLSYQINVRIVLYVIFS